MLLLLVYMFLFSLRFGVEVFRTPSSEGGRARQRRLTDETLITMQDVQLSKNHNSLDLDVIVSPNAQDAFWPIPGLISCTMVTGNVGTTHHAHAVQVDDL